jgi:hypothetical protein
MKGRTGALYREMESIQTGQNGYFRTHKSLNEMKMFTGLIQQHSGQRKDSVNLRVDQYRLSNLKKREEKKIVDKGKTAPQTPI